MWFWTQSPAFPDCVASFICLAPPAFSGSRKCPVSSTFLRLAHLYICVLAFLLMQVLRPGVFSPPSHKTVPQWGLWGPAQTTTFLWIPFWSLLAICSSGQKQICLILGSLRILNVFLVCHFQEISISIQLVVYMVFPAS